jgi:16S rRNA (guanine1516-N2)-methyltransferase
MEKFVVTTSHKPSKEQVLKAKELAEKLGVDYIPRRQLSERVNKGEIDFYYVVEASGRIVIRWKGGEFFFHPSVAKVRMKNLESGGRDYLIDVMKFEGDEVVLDTTFGLGAEAILMAAFLPRGKVIGLEKSIHIYNVVKYGLLNYKPNVRWIEKAMKRIELIHTDFKEFIRKAEDESYDIVYCDPMFENPKFESSSMNPLRPFASYDTITEEDVRHMLRIAKKKVVLKSHVKDSLFERIKVDYKTGSKKSGVIYGVIEKR